MTKRIILLIVAATALGACDLFEGERVEVSNNAATANMSSGNSSTTATTSAGISSSRSLAGLSGGSGGDGGKDPGGAIQAGAGDGVIDPRFVGNWTDNGDCKQVMELRPDGTFLASSGLTGTWRVGEGELHFNANGELTTLRIDSVEPNRIVTTNAEGNTGPSTRC